MTFGQAARAWLDYVEHDRKRDPKTIRDYRLAVERVFLPEFGEAAPLAQLDADRFEAWRVEQVRAGRRSDRTINKYLVILPVEPLRALEDRDPAGAGSRRPPSGG